MKNLSIGFYNGDLRSVYMAKLLSLDNSVYIYNIDNDKLNNYVELCDTPEELFAKAHIIIPPVSLFINNEERVSEFISYISEKNYIFGGCFPGALTDYMEQNNIKYYDYMKNEEFVQYNTIATAEGTIATIIKETKVNLCECKVLITGYGRCAKTLAEKLKNLCFKVGISARKESDLESAQEQEYLGLHISDLKEHINEYQVIVNTIPALILTEDILMKISKDTLIVDIASKPGGVDFKYCENAEIKALSCLGLPGKYAPKSTAIFLCRLLSHTTANFE